ncbi:MAG: 16S rRNA (uracil(1498)-N(3))-methyltransferase [Chitinophagaceae bacterium]|nr:16S rRNA (uracil(1498)-N(3))-methyltransferase [Chitinophagaceae bacterium]
MYPFFYIEKELKLHEKIVLDEENSRHAIQSLRLRKGEKIHLTNGKGMLATAELNDVMKKKCSATIHSLDNFPPPKHKITIAISLLKNTNRFEWFLEKATEIGVHEIIPMICERTVKTSVRMERFKAICVSAMLQSQQCRFPLLSAPKHFKEVIGLPCEGSRLIAHCYPSEKLNLATLNCQENKVILIGPEGDFTGQEVEQALDYGFLPVSLGKNRLRTETAGLVAVTLLTIH